MSHILTTSSIVILTLLLVLGAGEPTAPTPDYQILDAGGHLGGVSAVVLLNRIPADRERWQELICDLVANADLSQVEWVGGEDKRRHISEYAHVLVTFFDHTDGFVPKRGPESLRTKEDRLRSKAHFVGSYAFNPQGPTGFAWHRPSGQVRYDIDHTKSCVEHKKNPDQ